VKTNNTITTNTTAFCWTVL